MAIRSLLKLPLGFSPVRMDVPPDRRAAPGDKRCVYCGGPLHASARSLQVRCPTCFKHVSVQDVTLRGDVRTERTITAGTITIPPDARVQGDLVGGRVEIAGRVLGNVLAAGDCTITATGKVAGTILCRRLRIDAGAQVVGAIERITDTP